MKIDFSARIVNLDGEPVEENGVVLTLGSLSINALLATLADLRGQTEQLPGTEKVRQATLAQKIHTEGSVDLSAEDITMLKDRIGRAYSPLAVMQAWQLLDPASP